ncbi:phosphoadenosine phosphosulfate reductase family protein [Mucilaginibacter gossypii]|uniref:phosphoadenosine phosphosulfate reductase domain-containing protein n=1 Tax=Mucilaginibacter gossypii TaxID=551996 RepID=UPI000DCF0969|nr:MULTISPECIES: phosphoadenosine phosphosulfate reductase family protein [Mucilaginibacter]QTE37504.1 phosphoadenosine phosphosulfate reductase family protein [Mucilaginibacter gossypii]RAV52330.1 phosphoadenosine phosphosulfate reductase [Mucilaginibacter rubeus]
MKTVQTNLFEGISHRLQMTDSFELSWQSLSAYGPKYNYWCVAWSGGKDSTTLVTFIVWSILSGKVKAPKKIYIMYADTRLELTPLFYAAQKIMEELAEHGYQVEVVMASMENRFLTYIIGRGVPPPNNATFRWCTSRIKIEPMQHALETLVGSLGEKVLMLTGVRQGESAIRDQRIIMSCSKNGAECGQGWYQETLPTSLCDTLAPILHWRVCHVWEWLKHWAPLPEYGDFSTELIADAYGGDEAEELNARTGCMGCPLTDKDTALDNLLKKPKWQYLAPLKRLRPIYRELRKPQNRLRKTGLEDNNEKNKQRMGPITMAAREWAFNEILSIQNEINIEAAKIDMPAVYLLNDEEQAFIRKCWAENLWPNKWTGDEPTADTPMDTVYSDGSIQPLIQFGE